MLSLIFTSNEITIVSKLLTIVSKLFKSDSLESHNSLKLSFINIRGLRFNFVGCESFLVVSVFTDFPSNTKGDVPFYRTT